MALDFRFWGKVTLIPGSLIETNLNGIAQQGWGYDADLNLASKVPMIVLLVIILFNVINPEWIDKDEVLRPKYTHGQLRIL